MLPICLELSIILGGNTLNVEVTDLLSVVQAVVVQFSLQFICTMYVDRVEVNTLTWSGLV